MDKLVEEFNPVYLGILYIWSRIKVVMDKLVEEFNPVYLGILYIWSRIKVAVMDKLVEELTGIETALTTLQAQVEFSRFNTKILKYVFHSSPHLFYKYFFRKITFVDYDF